MTQPKPLVLNDLLIQNVNTWGNVQYNIPLRVSSNETRTGTSIALRHIPAIPHSLDCVRKYLFTIWLKSLVSKVWYNPMN